VPDTGLPYIETEIQLIWQAGGMLVGFKLLSIGAPDIGGEDASNPEDERIHGFFHGFALSMSKDAADVSFDILKL
jgi:hypothetical protein